MRLRQFNALKATLDSLALLNPNGVLVYGENTYTIQSFCCPININKARTKLLGCKDIDIKAIGFYVQAESRIVAWLQAHIRLPTNRVWWNMVSPSNWLKYNISSDLYLLHLSVAHKHYYICMRYEQVLYYRQHLALPHHG